VSVTGTTGARAEVSSQLDALVQRARSVTDVPLLAGFGISTPEQAAAAAALADGVIVGSHAVEVAHEGGAEALRAYVTSLREALAYGTNNSAGLLTAPTTGSVTNVSPSTHSIDASAQAGVVHE